MRTSSATTANPLPCLPARAASMAALSASKLVWSAIRATALTMSLMLDACRSSSATISTEAIWRCAAMLTLPTDTVTSVWMVEAMLCMLVARVWASCAACICWVIADDIAVTAARDCCAAPEASWAPAAMVSDARRNSSDALAASLMPEASSAEAAAMRSAACCCLAMVRARRRRASASRLEAAGDGDAPVGGKSSKD